MEIDLKLCMLKESLVTQNYGEVLMSKILDDVKSTLDFASEEDSGFDSRLLLEIDGIVGTLSQLTKVQPDCDITKDTEWEQLLKESDKHLLRLVKQYIFLSIRVVFDPPAGSVLTTLTTSINNTAHRIIIQKGEYNEQ